MRRDAILVKPKIQSAERSANEFHSQPLVPAAQYLRMSTDHQKLSLESQSIAIHQYAQAHGFKVVHSYQDAGKSGLVLKHRNGLQQLLQDVVSGSQFYQAILVYDVSRWGRFQDSDEAAHYEFVCRQSGIPVYYCAETFANDGLTPSVVMKALKRVMAAEYSRELSARLRRVKRILTLQGFSAGSHAGYGLRRMLVSFDGSPKRRLAEGERKAPGAGRVILIPGPALEISRVREIYRLAIVEKKGGKTIARLFNRKRIKYCGDRKWTQSGVDEILTNPKYVGTAAWGRTTGILGGRRIPVPKEEWTIKPGAYVGLVSQETFDDAQRALLDRTCHRSNEELLERLRKLFLRHKRLSEEVIGRHPQDVPSANTYQHRFGSLRRAYNLIGYSPRPDTKIRTKARDTRRKIETQILRNIAKQFRDDVEVIRQHGFGRRIVRFRDGIRLSLLLCACITTARGDPRWIVRVLQEEREYPTLLCLCTTGNDSVQDMYLVPKVETTRQKRFRIKERDPWLKRGIRVTDLARLKTLVDLSSTRSSA